jgi:NADH-quinone oxidoreductase subunit M
MILDLLLLIPLLGAIAVMIFQRYARPISLASALALVVAGVLALLSFDPGAGMQLLQHVPWLEIGSFSMNYSIGVDGISLSMVLLTILLGLVGVLVSRREIHTREAAYYSILLVLVASIIGVFISLDLILFFVFWEAVLVLTFLLILIWGGDNRRYASMKFLIYTGFGSALLLLAIIILAINTDSTSLTAIMQATISPEAGSLVFCLILLATFIKMPIVPFHTWLPDAHVQAPTAGSILLAGVMLKMGAYALLRFSFLSTPGLRIFLFWMGVITILYGAWVCLAQKNLKKLIAYSSINHMGFVLVGIAVGSSLGTTGAVFEMISHGLLAALLFALAGLVHERTGTFDIEALHGLIAKMPKTGWLLVTGALGALGLPSMSGFIAEFLIISASFQAFGMLTLVPIGGMILAGGYFLRLLAKAVFGKSERLHANEDHVDMTPFVILLASSFLLGILPFLLIGLLGAA